MSLEKRAQELLEQQRREVQHQQEVERQRISTLLAEKEFVIGSAIMACIAECRGLALEYVDLAKKYRLSSESFTRINNAIESSQSASGNMPEIDAWLVVAPDVLGYDVMTYYSGIVVSEEGRAYNFGPPVYGKLFGIWGLAELWASPVGKLQLCEQEGFGVETYLVKWRRLIEAAAVSVIRQRSPLSQQEYEDILKCT